MKAVILAAGKGERLKEVTQTLPKPMIEFNNKPILQNNIELCIQYGIKDIYINLHHLPDVITNYFGDGEKLGVNIRYSYEEELLGTAGAIRKVAEMYKDFASAGKFDEPFYVIYGDNYSNYDLNSLKEKLIETGSLAVIGFHYREDTTSSGVAEFDETFRIKKFVEKPIPGESDSHWVNAGIYCLNKEIFNYIPAGFSDFAKDIFPALLKGSLPIYGICEDTIVKAFDTPEMYKHSFKSGK